MSNNKEPQTTPLPCPFCGCKETELSERTQENYMLVCKNNRCKAEGPWSKKIELDDHGATDAWNRRV